MLSKPKSGGSLLEVVLALAIFSLIAAAFISLTLGSVANVSYGTDFLTAETLADQGVGIKRATRDNAWNTLADGVETATFDNRFQRTITISPINLETKAVKVEVAWPSPVGTIQKVTRQTKLANWDSRDWIQTDWSGGAGQSVWLNANRYTSDDGNLDVSTPGALKLKSVANSVGSTNSDFTTGTTGWSFAPWNFNVGEVTPTGAWQSAGGNPNGYAAVTIPANARNNTIGGYWQQAVTVTQDNLPLVCSTDWRIVNWKVAGNNVNDFRFFIFLDKLAGAPTLGEAVWASPLMVGATNWNSVPNIDCSAFAPTPGTYYFKIAVWLDARSGQTGPITVGFDNARLAWSKIIYAPNGSLTSSAFDMRPPAGGSPVQLINWDESVPACSPACAIKLNIKAAATSAGLVGAPWSPDFALAPGALINPSYNGNRWVQYRATLTGDGASTPALNEVRFNYK